MIIKWRVGQGHCRHFGTANRYVGTTLYLVATSYYDQSAVRINFGAHDLVNRGNVIITCPATYCTRPFRGSVVSASSKRAILALNRSPVLFAPVLFSGR